MVNERAWDETSVLLLTERYIPDMETILAAEPRRYPRLWRGSLKFPSREEALAWTLSARAAQLASSRGLGSRNLQPETWILGAPQKEDAVFSDWFAAEAANPTYSDYRILIHRDAQAYPTKVSPYSIFGSVYGDGRAWEKLNMRALKGRSKELRRDAREFLAELLDAYKAGYAAVESTIRSTRHPYWHSHIR